MRPHSESVQISEASHATAILKSAEIVLDEYQSINDFFAFNMLPVFVQPFRLELDDEVVLKLTSNLPLNENEASSIIQKLTPERDELLKMLQVAGFAPSFHRGGYLQTTNTTYSAEYPKINHLSSHPEQNCYIKSMLKPHRNISPCGASVDQFMYMLSGTVYFFFLNGSNAIHLDLTVSGTDGWLLVFKGGIPHGGSFSANATQLGVVIGPKQWLVDTEIRMS